MKHISHIKIRISFLLLLLALCVVVEPAVRSIASAEQILALEELPADDTSEEETCAEEASEEELQMLCVPALNIDWGVRSECEFHAHLPHTMQDFQSIDSPPELV